MKPLRSSIARLFLIALACSPVSAADAAPLRVVEAEWLGSLEPGRGPLALPEGYWTLLLLDPARSESRGLLDQLAADGGLPDGMVIAVLGDAQVARELRARTPALQLADWRAVDARIVLPRLELGGTPLLLGIDPEGTVRWQRPGNLRAQPAVWRAQAAQWSARVAPTAERPAQP